VSLQCQCLFLRPGTVGTVSGSVMSQTDIEVTDCISTYNCSMQVEHVFSSEEMFMWPHRAGLSNKLDLDLDSDSNMVDSTTSLLVCAVT